MFSFVLVFTAPLKFSMPKSQTVSNFLHFEFLHFSNCLPGQTFQSFEICYFNDPFHQTSISFAGLFFFQLSEMLRSAHSSGRLIFCIWRSVYRDCRRYSIENTRNHALIISSEIFCQKSKQPFAEENNTLYTFEFPSEFQTVSPENSNDQLQKQQKRIENFSRKTRRLSP